MQRSMGLRWAMVLLSSALLSACLVGKDTTKNYAITLPSKLPTYANGHFINFSYELYTVNFTPMSLSGGIAMTWTEPSIIQLPFALGPRNVVQHRVKEKSPEGDERDSIQYITQDSTGSMYLNAFKGSDSNSYYWPHNSISLATPIEPETKLIFASPIDDGTTSTVGVPQHESQAMDFSILGNCSSSGGSGNCTEVANWSYSDYTVMQIDRLTTPIGKIDAYKVHYTGIMTRPVGFSETAYFDYRVSCSTAGSTLPVSFDGIVWIYPPIGPVKLSNRCTEGSRTVYFAAQITSTNLPH